jgi:hypothetical protein
LADHGRAKRADEVDALVLPLDLHLDPVPIDGEVILQPSDSVKRASV